jgi:hypothetical protein
MSSDELRIGDRIVKVMYLCHPVAGDVSANVARARRWLRFLLGYLPGIVVIAPWIHDIEELPMRDEYPADRDISLARCTITASICDGVILVGGRVTAGMALEAARAKEVLDLTALGDEPPGGGGA